MITVNYISGSSQDCRPVLHLLDESAVWIVGVAQGVEPLARGTLNDQRVDFSGANGAESLLGLTETRLERLETQISPTCAESA